MRKFSFLTALLLFMYGCQGGSESDTTKKATQSLQEASDGLVLTIAGETITSEEIISVTMEQLKPIAKSGDYERFRQQAGVQLEELIKIRISNILLYQEAKDKIGEGMEQVLERAAEDRVRQFIVDSGGDYLKAEQALEQQGLDWASFKQEHKKKIMTEYYYTTSLLPKHSPITYSELLASYNDMKDEYFALPEEIKCQLLDIEIRRLEVADPNRPRLEQARELADKLLKQVKAGKDFLELSKEHSGVFFAPHSKPVQLKDLKYEILAQEASKLRPGDFAEHPIETPKLDHIFIMKLEYRRPESYLPFEQVQSKVRAKIVSDRRKEVEDKILAGFNRRAERELNDEFTEFCLRKIYQMSNEPSAAHDLNNE
jgi:hypothetical protein